MDATMSAGEAPRRRPILPNAVLGVIIAVVVESMFFAGLISALSIVQSADPNGVWPPFGEPPAPVPVGGAVLGVLALSVVTLFLAGRRMKPGRDPRSAGGLILATALLGGVAVAIQLVSVVNLHQLGLTFISSPHGSFYYLIIGLHTAQVAGTALLMARAYGELRADGVAPDRFWALQILWYFIVVVWPFLFVRVYL